MKRFHRPLLIAAAVAATALSTHALAAQDDILSHRCVTLAPEAVDRQAIDDRLTAFLRMKSARGQSLHSEAASVTIPVWFHVINKGSGIANGDIPSPRSTTRSPC